MFLYWVEKRGVSNVVGAVLVILAIVVAVVILWNVVLSLIVFDGGSGGADISIVTSGGYTVYDAEEDLASVQIRRGMDEVDVKEIEVVFLVEGNSVNFIIPEEDVLKRNSVKLYKFALSGEGVPSSVRIVPSTKISITGGVIMTGEAVGDVRLAEGEVVLTAGESPYLPKGVFAPDDDSDPDSVYVSVGCSDLDYDGDGFVGFDDFTYFAACYGNNSYGCSFWDLDSDGNVSFNDFTYFDVWYGEDCSVAGNLTCVDSDGGLNAGVYGEVYVQAGSFSRTNEDVCVVVGYSELVMDNSSEQYWEGNVLNCANPVPQDGASVGDCSISSSNDVAYCAGADCYVDEKWCGESGFDGDADEFIKCENGCSGGACVINESCVVDSDCPPVVENFCQNEITWCTSTMNYRCSAGECVLYTGGGSCGPCTYGCADGGCSAEGETNVTIFELMQVYNNTGPDYTRDRVRFRKIALGDMYTVDFVSEGVGTVNINGKVYGVLLEESGGNEVVWFNAFRGGEGERWNLISGGEVKQLELYRVYNSSGGYIQDRVEFRDIVSGVVYDVEFNLEGVGLVNIGGKVVSVLFEGLYEEEIVVMAWREKLVEKDLFVL